MPNFTELSVQKLPEGMHFDGKLTNFGIRVGKTRKTWIAVKGENRTKITLGHYPAVSLAEARKMAQETFVAPTHTKPRITFTDALAAFLELPRWRDSTRNVMRSTLKPFTWKKQLHLITHEDVVQVLEKIERPSARFHAQKDIKTFFNWAVPRYIDHSPCIGLRTETQPTRDRVLSDEEVKAIWNACAGIFGTIVQLLILTGQRRGEIAGLHSNYIAGDIVTLPAEVVKNKTAHTFPIGHMTQQLLPQKTGYLFGDKPYATFSRHLLTLKKDSGVQEFTLHDLRRTYSTTMAKLGVPLHITELLLNHKGMISGVAATYNRYTYIEEKRQAVLTYETHIANSGHGKTQCIQSMIMDDWNADASIVVIDSQGDLINNLLAHCPHLDRVVLIDPETCPPAMNIFANKAKGEYELATAIELFEYIFSALDVKLTGQQSLVYRYLSRLLMDIPGATIETMRDLLQPGGTTPYQAYIDQLGGNAKAFFDEFQKDKNNQYAETKQAVLRRLLMVLESETFSKMLASEKMAFDFPDLLDSGKIILISTSKRLLKDGASLFGRIFIALVMQAVMARKGNRRRTYLYIDEFADYAEDSQVLFNLFEQARKYELGLVVCHQYLGQLPQQLARSISANTAIKFAGGVSAEDARALASQMQTRPENIQAEPQLSFHAWFKGQRATSWKIKPGRLEALPKHSERELDQFRDHMRMMYGARRGKGRPTPPPAEDRQEPDAW